MSTASDDSWFPRQITVLAEVNGGLLIEYRDGSGDANAGIQLVSPAALVGRTCRDASPWLAFKQSAERLCRELEDAEEFDLAGIVRSHLREISAIAIG